MLLLIVLVGAVVIVVGLSLSRLRRSDTATTDRTPGVATVALPKITFTVEGPTVRAVNPRRVPPMDWHESEEHKSLLLRFRHAREVDDYYPDYWLSALGETQIDAVQRFAAEGLVVPASVEAKLDRKFTLPQLKEICKECGLRVGGKKAELIARLMESAAEVVHSKTDGTALYELTLGGRDAADQIEHERKECEEQAMEALRHHDFARACALLHYDDEGELDDIFTVTPGILARMDPARLESVRVMTAIRTMLNETSYVAQRWLPEGFETGLKMDGIIAGNMITFYLSNRGQLRSFREMGLKKVQVRCIPDSNSCGICTRNPDKVYDISHAPELPRPGCSSEMGCRCNYEYVDSDMDALMKRR